MILSWRGFLVIRYDSDGMKGSLSGHTGYYKTNFMKNMVGIVMSSSILVDGRRENISTTITKNLKEVILLYVRLCTCMSLNWYNTETFD